MKSTKKLTTEIFTERSRLIHNGLYDYSMAEYINNASKVKIICPTHGEFQQKANDHLNGSGCRECGFYKNTRKKSLGKFLMDARKKHGNFYDYSNVVYTNSADKIKIICPTHGEFQQKADTHLRGAGCRFCGYQKNTNKKSKEKFIEDAREKHGDKYNYDKVDYLHSKEKVNIICPTHGEFQQSPNGHLRNSGCKKCDDDRRGLLRRLGIDSFISKANSIHGDVYDYSLSRYNTTMDKIDIICDKHGVFNQLVGNHLSGTGCPKCSYGISRPELKIKSILDELGVECIQHDRGMIPPFELDFVIPDRKIALEFNGIYYHSENNGGKNRNYHLNKTDKCEERGIQLLHIFENEYIQKYNLLKFKLRSIFGKNKYKIYARKCKVCELSPNLKKTFNEKYHIQGDSQSCVNLGLFYKNRLVQVMTFSKRRKALGSKHVQGEYELSRMSSIKGFTVVGGASKLLKYFEKSYKPMRLISYADRRWSIGGVYNKLGFIFIKNTPPNYWYFYNKKADKPLYHRYKFAKHTLDKQLINFDPNLTEWENMKNNHYDRIWDSGSMLFEKVYL